MSRLSDVAQFDGSTAALVVAELIEQHGIEGAHEKIDELLDSMTNIEAAALNFDWSNVWARPKQVIPAGDWEMLGHLEGRGTGKTVGCSHIVNDEVEAGRAQLICLIAQDEQSSVDLHVTGPSGLIATAKPWFRPEWRASDLQLVWPNGARAYVRTPEVPGKIRGLEYHLTWASELQSWPVATMDEAWMNVMISTRLGLARVIWDATAKRRHALLTRLIKEAEQSPQKNRLIRGNTYENALNLGRGYIEKIERRYGGTRQGEEELFAKMFDDAEGATAKQTWIEKTRRPRPEQFLRRVVSIDPAVTKKDGNDSTGIVVAGLGADRQGYVLADLTEKYTPDEWVKVVLDAYEREECDLIVVERNKAGDFPTQTIRSAARDRKCSVIVIGKKEKPRHMPGVVYVREVYAQGEKADRARPLSTAYERGQISHVEGVKLADLEDILTTWVPVPGARSPDRLDALVHAMIELLDLNSNEPDLSVGHEGIAEASRIVTEQTSVKPLTHALVAALGGSQRGGRL
jgi:phage terminase large subunit-like protein